MFSQVAPKAWVLSTFAGELFLSLYIHYRQFSHIHSIHGVPRKIQEFGDGMFTSVDMDMSREFTRDKLLHSVWKKFYTVILWMIIISLNGIHVAWNVSRFVSPILWAPVIDPVIARNMTFTFCIFFANEVLMLPVSFAWLKLKEKYEHEQPKRPEGSMAYWITLYLKTIILESIPVVVAGGILAWILKTLDNKSFEMEVLIFGSFFYVYVLLNPSLDIFMQLAGHIKNTPKFSSPQLDRLCSSVGFPTKNLLLFQRGHRASHDNAFYFGFLWFRRIVVFHDITNQNHNNEESSPHTSDIVLKKAEIEAIVAHELGHWKFDHSNKDLLIWHFMHTSRILLAFVLRSSFPEIFQYWGLRVNQNDVMEGISLLPCGVVAYYLILRLYSHSFECVYQAMQHSYENEADKFASRLHYGRDLGKALIKISIISKSFPSQDLWYSLFYHSHPSLVTRLQQIAKNVYSNDDEYPNHNRNRPYRTRIPIRLRPRLNRSELNNREH